MSNYDMRLTSLMHDPLSSVLCVFRQPW